jgi:CRP-like cAMP-binding protein
MAEFGQFSVDADSYLSSAGPGRKILQLRPKQSLFIQGDIADSVFYLLKGRAKITVVSDAGKEATITLLSEGEFAGAEALVSATGTRLSTATAVTACTAVKIKRDEMLRALREERQFSEVFLSSLLDRIMRIQADLVDQLINTSEKRLARILLLMAEYDRAGEPEPYIPKISQETLAEMIGTTRSRVSFFMNRFRKQGLIRYDGRIQVRKSRLNVFLRNQLPVDEVRLHDDHDERRFAVGIPAD